MKTKIIIDFVRDILNPRQGKYSIEMPENFKFERQVDLEELISQNFLSGLKWNFEYSVKDTFMNSPEVKDFIIKECLKNDIIKAAITQAIADVTTEKLKTLLGLDRY